MEKKKNKRRFWDNWFGILLEFIIIFTVGGLICSPLMMLCPEIYTYYLAKFTGQAVDATMSFKMLIFLYIITGLMGVVFAVWMAIKHKDAFRTMLPGHNGNGFKTLGIGLGLGLLMNGIQIGFAALASNITLAFKGGLTIWMFILAFFAVFLQSTAEEVIDRVFLYRKFNKTYVPLVGILLSSAVFSMMHGANNGITFVAYLNLFMIALFYVLIVFYFDSVWICFFHHTAWNFCQNFLFGLPNSGNANEFAIFAPAGNITSGFFYDATFGVEGTLATSIMLIISLVAIVLIGKKTTGKTIKDMLVKPVPAEM